MNKPLSLSFQLALVIPCLQGCGQSSVSTPSADMTAPKPVVTMKHPAAVLSIAFHPKAQLVASACEDGSVRLWEIDKSSPTRDLRAHSNEVMSVAFNFDGSMLASGGADGQIHFWDTATWKVLRTVTASTLGIDCVAFSPTTNVLASGGHRTALVTFWDPGAGQKISEFTNWIQETFPDVGQHRHTSGAGVAVTSLAFNPSGDLLACVGSEINVALCSMSDRSRTKIGEYQGEVYKAAQEEWVVFDKTGANRIHPKYFEERTLLAQFPTAMGAMSGSPTYFCTDAAFSNDGQLLAAACTDNNVRLFSPSRKALTSTLKGHTERVTCVRFSPDSKLLASSDAGGVITLWSVDRRASLGPSLLHSVGVTSLAFSPDGKQLASADLNGLVCLWNITRQR